MKQYYFNNQNAISKKKIIQVLIFHECFSLSTINVEFLWKMLFFAWKAENFAEKIEINDRRNWINVSTKCDECRWLWRKMNGFVAKHLEQCVLICLKSAKEHIIYVWVERFSRRVWMRFCAQHLPKPVSHHTYDILSENIGRRSWYLFNKILIMWMCRQPYTCLVLCISVKWKFLVHFV